MRKGKDLRESVCAANLELARSGLVLYTWGNVSGIDRTEGIVWIKPSGVPYDQLTPEKIVPVSLESGEALERNWRPSSDTPTHLELYRNWPQIGGVVHTHSLYATAWAQAGTSIPCLGTTHADDFFGPIPCTRRFHQHEVEQDYEKNTGKLIVETFSTSETDPLQCPGVLVNGHGPFTWGKNPQEAVYKAVILEYTAKIAFLTLQIQPNAPSLQKYLLEKHFFRKHGANAYYGQTQDTT